MRSKLLLAAFLSLTVLNACGKGVRPETRDTVRFSALETDAVEPQIIQDPGPQANDEQLSTYKPIVQGVRENRGDLFAREDVGGQLERIEGVFIATGEYLELVSYYQDAVDQHGIDNATGRRLAWALIRLGQQKQARATIDQLLEAAPEDAFVHFLDGAYYLQNERNSVDDRKKAIDAWTRVLERDANFRGYQGITAAMVKTQVDRMTASLSPEEQSEIAPDSPESAASQAASAVTSQANAISTPETSEVPEPSDSPGASDAPDAPDTQDAETIEEPVAVEPDAPDSPDSVAAAAPEDASRQYKLLVARGEMALAAQKFEEAETLFLQAKKIRPDGFAAELGQLQAGWGNTAAQSAIRERASELAKRDLTGDEAFRLGRFAWTRMQNRKLARELLEEAKAKAPNRASAADAILKTMR